MRLLLVAAFAALLAGCSEVRAFDRSAAETEVWDRALEGVAFDDSRLELLGWSAKRIVPEESVGALVGVRTLESLPADMPGLEPATLDAFRAGRDEDRVIDRELAAARGIEVRLSRDSWSRAKGTRWIELSSVGFHGEQALVHRTIVDYTGYANGEFLFLHHRDGGWHVVRALESWRTTGLF